MTPSPARALQVLVLVTCTVMTATRCLDEAQLKVRADRFQRRYRARARLDTESEGAVTCGQALVHAQLHHLQHQHHLHHRALSPWTYRINRDECRFPRDVMEARCLCQGCILKRPNEDQAYEEHGFNSVPVYTHVLVLTKTRCTRQRHKHRLVKRMLRVSVGCTCAIPEYKEDQEPVYEYKEDREPVPENKEERKPARPG